MTGFPYRLIAAIPALFVACLIAVGPATAAPMTDAERARVLASLKWVSGPTSLPIGAPAARFDLARGMMAVTGSDAQRVWEILQTGTVPDLQAFILVPETKAAIFVTYAEPGYVRMDDWNTFNPDAFMAKALEYNRERTPAREAAGLSPMLDGHWEAEPQINRTDAVVHWALSYFDPKKNQRGLNIWAIRLGRRGYVRLGMSILMDNYEKHPEVIELLEKNFRFEPGAGYADFAPGDTVAPFGISQLTMRPFTGE